MVESASRSYMKVKGAFGTHCSFMAGAEIILSLLFFILLWKRDVDWSVFWFSLFADAPEKMPWGFWLLSDLAALALFYHGVCLIAQRRWALVVAGVMGIAGVGICTALITRRLSQGFTLQVAFDEFMSRWGYCLLLIFFFSSVMREGFAALKKNRSGVQEEAVQEPINTEAGEQNAPPPTVSA